MKELILNEEKEDIKNKIYTIRGVQVMLDSDLAKLYECTNGTKDINKAVKREKGNRINKIHIDSKTCQRDVPTEN